MTESATQRTILEYLERCGIMATRVNSGKIRVGKRWIKLAEEGTADIICNVPPNGRYLEIETKTENGKLRPKQIERRVEVERRGGRYLVARSLDDVRLEIGR